MFIIGKNKAADFKMRFYMPFFKSIFKPLKCDIQQKHWHQIVAIVLWIPDMYNFTQGKNFNKIF